MVMLLSDRTLSHGLWRVTAPAPPECTPLEGKQQTDVAVIGAGYTGLSAALHLARAGTDVVLLEANEIGFGGAGRNVGLVNAGLWLMPDRVEEILGPTHGAQLVNILGRSPDLVYKLIEEHGMACEAVRNGTLHCAHSSSGYRALQQREAQWQARGAPVTLLDRKAAAARIGSDHFYGALLDERAGTIQPLAYAFGLARAAVENRAILHEGSPVTACKRASGRWLLTTPSGQLSARFVVLAVEGYPDHAFKIHEKTQIPFNYFQFATSPLPQNIAKTILPGREGAWDTRTILSSYRLDAAGRLIIGSVGQVERMGYHLHRKWTQRRIKSVFPQIGDIRLEHAWNGCISMTPDHVPRFHILGENMATITSYNGRGIGPGTVFGKLLARYALGGSESDIPLPVKPQRPVLLRKLRGFIYETGARAFHLLQRW